MVEVCCSIFNLYLIYYKFLLGSTLGPFLMAIFLLFIGLLIYFWSHLLLPKLEGLSIIIPLKGGLPELVPINFLWWGLKLAFN